MKLQVNWVPDALEKLPENPTMLFCVFCLLWFFCFLFVTCFVACLSTNSNWASANQVLGLQLRHTYAVTALNRGVPK